MPLQIIPDAEVRRLLTFDLALEALEATFRQFAAGGAAVQPRVYAALGGKKLSTMSAVNPADGMLGAKVYATVLDQPRFLVLLFSAETGAPLAVLEADALTEIRTSAVSAVAARALARPDATTLALFGTGVQARGHIGAFCRALPIRAVRVVSRGDAGAFCAAMAERYGVEVTQARDAATALAECRLVATTTRAETPLFPGSLLQPGTFIAAIGAALPQTRELDDTAIRRATPILVEWLPQAKQEAGDLIQAAKSGALDWDRVRELAPVLAGAAPGRAAADDIVLFKGIGIALEDVAVGAAIYRRALAEGLIAPG